jgi:taurine dioxygenase
VADIQPLTGHLGAVLTGLDLRDASDDAAVEVLHEALLQNLVVFVPGQFLGPAELLALARRFGEVMVNPQSPKVDGFPEVTELVTHDGRSPDIWHFDTSYAEEPPMASLLTMVESPAVGGDTLWASGYALYDALSAPMKTMLDGLTVAYDSATHGRPGFRADHPLIAVHPETGRRSLYFDPMYSTRIPELERAESDAIVTFLRGRVTDPTFACRHRWSEGDLAMWDNRCTLHRVASDYVGRRVIQRVTIAGGPPVAAREP